MALVLASPVSLFAQAFGFGSPAPLNSQAATDSTSDLSAKLATDGSGNWITVWISQDSLSGTIGSDADVFVSRSTDNGATWSAVAALNSDATTDTADDLIPAIACDGNDNWIVMWVRLDLFGSPTGTDFDIMYIRSTDDGTSWSAPAALYPSAAIDAESDFGPSVAADGSGNWVAVWSSRQDLGAGYGTDADIFVSKSTDDGVTWSTPTALNSNATTDSGDDSAPGIAAGGVDKWVAVWESNDDLGGPVDTDFDIFVARSDSGAASWFAVAALNSPATTDTGADLRPTIATDRVGRWIAVWESNDDRGGTVGLDNDILVSYSTDDGATWSAADLLNLNADTDTGGDFRAKIAPDGNGNWVAVWDSGDTLGMTIGADSDILVALSTDGGQSWSSVPGVLNDNAASDAGHDEYPAIATNGLGRWIAVWESTDTLGTTIGTDSDILVSTSFGLPVELSAFGLE